jgi:hypothetical protein
MAPKSHGWIEGREVHFARDRGIVHEVDSVQATLLDLLRRGVAIHADAIADIASRGEISIIVIEPSETWREALHAHGWNGELVFAMSDRMQKAMSCADDVTERWIARPRSDVVRIFAVIQDESLLVNSDAGLLSLEPGSTD